MDKIQAGMNQYTERLSLENEIRRDLQRKYDLKPKKDRTSNRKKRKIRGISKVREILKKIRGSKMPSVKRRTIKLNIFPYHSYYFSQGGMQE